MFTGIITHLGSVDKILQNEENDLVIELAINKNQVYRNLDLGCSISCNGICLTLINKELINNKINLKFQASQETINKTNIANWQEEDLINIEFALRMGDEFGGHMVSGHIDCISKVIKISKSKESFIFMFEIDSRFKKYLSKKGSITINGTSITINNVYNNNFDVNIIPHTFQNTNFCRIKEGDIVNIEFDMIGKYLENLLKNERS